MFAVCKYKSNFCLTDRDFSINPLKPTNADFTTLLASVSHQSLVSSHLDCASCCDNDV